MIYADGRTPHASDVEMKIHIAFQANGGHCSLRKLQRHSELLGLSWDTTLAALKNLGAREVRADFESGWALPGSTRVPKERQAGAEAPTASVDDNASIMPGSRPITVDAEAEAAAQSVIQHLPRRRAQTDSRTEEPAPPANSDDAADAAARELTQFLPRRKSDTTK